MKTKNITLLVILMILLAVACQKKIEHPKTSEIARIDTLSNADLIARLAREVADVLELVYENDSAYREMLAAIYSGFYADERVLLSDLLHPESSAIYRSQRFREIRSDTGIFKRAFCEIIARRPFPLLRAFMMRPVPRHGFSATFDGSSAARLPAVPSAVELPEDVPIAIYFPYSENFRGELFDSTAIIFRAINVARKPTLVAAEGETDEGIGREPYMCSEGFGKTCYRQVLVNDNYAFVRPTHIVTTGAEEQKPQFEPPKSNGVNRVYHGSSRLTSQMDKFISLTGNGGGSEMKICRINGYLKTKDEQIDNFAGDIVTVQYTRGDIRSGRWKRIFSVWDPNWNYQDVEQVYAVYEEDTKGQSSFSGSLTTTLNLPGKPSLGKEVGEIGFKVSVVTQDEIIMQRKLDRNSYFKTEGKTQGWGVLPDANDFLPAALDWPVYDGGAAWSYTMPYLVY